MKKLSTLSFIALLTTSLFAQQKNLIENPSFETGEFSPWIKGPTADYTEPIISSKDSYNGTFNATYVDSKTSGFYQNIEINANTKYTLSFWYKSSGAGRGGRLWSLFITENNRTIDLITPASNNPLKNNGSFLPKTDEWKQHIVEFTSPDNISKFRLAVRAYVNSIVSFDDFSLVEGTLSVVEQSDFQKKVKISTIISDKLEVKIPSKSTINIYTVNGQLISSNRIDTGLQFINTQSLANGVYIVTIDNGSAKFTQKVIKK